ncbi:MAG: bifunctional UDP-3-O-[3-hydroxymyristoyl] N-acetylglucosamine deacetylase/3-hydroxyacyl-ACP dehydratase [Bacteroidales bacterium]|jgi:UDP-3-O-[3-hydroxymyristoyl] N-acetylglucosamine deacetylase/3-hydroxyacyl-[acyl-carrier-protein] dehydratase|nr:bifunctional UDP-3-O-[3-hydroxymyristoyl] N-acetylglucosamine deacetylase/3-hydroxyacyl-ACP dehydratase [Bacteroidales bacterium]
MDKQRTLQSDLRISGKGLHSGVHANICIKPAKPNFGIQFRRVDLENKPLIQAVASNVCETARGTTIENKAESAKVATVEHLLSSLYAMGIDNAEIEIDAPEVPILNGSADIWVRLIEQAGIEEQGVAAQIYEIKTPIRYIDDAKNIDLLAMPYDGFKIIADIDFRSDVIGWQEAKLDKLEDFKTQIAPCRTFVFLHEVEYLLNNNLIKGGDLDNALIFVEHTISEEQKAHLAQIFNKNAAEIKVEKGILNHIEKRFDNEPARHKLLDFIGDISLSGVRLKGEFIIKRPGHSSNVAFAKQIIISIMENAKKTPVYDPDKKPLYDIQAIKNILPHRFPMLLIDKIIEVGEDYVVGLKNVTGNESFFNGHFPKEPVMPGVLIVEALGQTGGVLALKEIQDPENYSTYFMKFEEVKFRNKVVPGDTLLLKLVLTEPIRRGIVRMQGTAYVGNKIAVEAKLMAQVAKNKQEKINE